MADLSPPDRSVRAARARVPPRSWPMLTKGDMVCADVRGGRPVLPAAESDCAGDGDVAADADGVDGGEVGDTAAHRRLLCPLPRQDILWAP